MFRSVQEYAWRCVCVCVFLFLTGLGKGVLAVRTKLCQWSWGIREFTSCLSSDKLEGWTLQCSLFIHLLTSIYSVLQLCCNLFSHRLFFFCLYILKADVILHSGTAAIALCTLCPSAVWQSIRCPDWEGCFSCLCNCCCCFLAFSSVLPQCCV